MAQTAAEQLEEIQTAISRILTHGQAFEVNGRVYRRADLATLYKQEERLKALVAREARGGIKVRRVVPVA